MVLLKDLFSKLENSRFSILVQFIKFGLVGVSNTAISYGIDMACFYILFANVNWPQGVRITVTSALAFFISVTNSFFWNNRYVFHSKKKKTRLQTFKTYIKTVSCYGITGLILSPVIKLLLSNYGCPYWIAGISTLVITIPLNFLLNKLWAFK